MTRSAVSLYVLPLRVAEGGRDPEGVLLLQSVFHLGRPTVRRYWCATWGKQLQIPSDFILENLEEKRLSF